MKINTPIFILTALAAAATGCNKTSAPEVPFDPVVRVAPEVAPATKGSYTTETLKEFDLFIGSANSKYSYTNTKFTKNETSGEWAPACQMLWEGKNAKFDFLAVAPPLQTSGHSITGVSGYYDPVFSFRVEAVQTEESNASDLLWAYKNEASREDTGLFDGEGKMRIAFSHALSKLKVRLTLGTEFNHDGVPQGNPVSELKIDGFHLETNVQRNDNLGVYETSPTGAEETVQAYLSKWDRAVDEAGNDDKTKNCEAVFECIVVPQNWTDFTVNFICGGKPYTYKATCGQYQGLLASGKAYTLPLTVGKDEVILGGDITASPWVDVDASDMETD